MINFNCNPLRAHSCGFPCSPLVIFSSCYSHWIRRSLILPCTRFRWVIPSSYIVTSQPSIFSFPSPHTFFFASKIHEHLHPAGTTCPAWLHSKHSTQHCSAVSDQAQSVAKLPPRWLALLLLIKSVTICFIELQIFSCSKIYAITPHIAINGFTTETVNRPSMPAGEMSNLFNPLTPVTI